MSARLEEHGISRTPLACRNKFARYMIDEERRAYDLQHGPGAYDKSREEQKAAGTRRGGQLFGSSPAAAPAAAPDDSYDSPEGRIARANEKRWPVGCKVHVPGYGDATVEGALRLGRTRAR